MNILALNAGSNSLKFEIVSVQPEGGNSGFGQSLISGAYDDIGKPGASFSLFDEKEERQKEQVDVPDHGRATGLLLDWVDQGHASNQGISSLADLHGVGHRVVHGADRFDGPVRITDDVLRQIEELEDLAPLHNASALKVIRAAGAKTGLRLPMVAAFDTVFHRTIPEEAALYPLPLQLAKRHKIRRYGFHGISHEYLMLRYAQIAKRVPSELNLITLHLEGGSSATAIRAGQSVDTSMGFTPLEGLMMGTRSGDIDPAVVTYLMRKEHLDSSEVETFLNKKCGLLGVSDTTADTRKLVRSLDDPRAKLALDLFSYRVRKYIGAYLAVLGHVDAIVFGGGIGENTSYARARICEGLAQLGIVFDGEQNDSVIDREGTISSPDSRIPVWVIPTRENLMVARHAGKHLSRTL
jgi:acetate kinase